MKIVLLYLVFGVLWILLSDKILYFFVSDMELYAQLQTYKGWFYVVVTGFLIFFLVYREIKKSESLASENLLLFRELNHRIKNNLQVLLGLVNIRLIKPENSENTRNELTDIHNQIQSIALAHKQLYHIGYHAEVDLKVYVESLISALEEILNCVELGIEIRTDIFQTRISLETAAPVGMIINETVTNSVKHAFKENAGGQIFILIEKDNQSLQLTIRDTGRGLPDQAFQSGTGMGMMLIEELARQVEGTLRFDNLDGTSVIVTFPLQEKGQV